MQSDKLNSESLTMWRRLQRC